MTQTVSDTTVAALTNHAPKPATGSVSAGSSGGLSAERVAEFGHELEALRREIELQLGESDVEHIRRIGQLSDRLEMLGRSLIMLSLEPLSFSVGTAALWAHKTLELMEIGHMALHGAYDGLPDCDRFQSEDFRWKAPIDESSWKTGHNLRHHQYTNIAGRDPDLDFGALRLSPRIDWKPVHALQPFSNYLTWLGFATAINLHVTGILDLYLRQGSSEVLQDATPAQARAAKRTFLRKWFRYYGREYVLFPALAGLFFPKVLFGNALSELGRDIYAAAIIYCGHVGADDFPNDYEPQTRAHWYVMQVQAARDVRVPEWVSILCGGLDLQIEHHLFPRLPPNRLREIAPRVQELCEKYGVNYRAASWPETLRSVVRELSSLRDRKKQGSQGVS
jgi:fatty acid desaturase